MGHSPFHHVLKVCKNLVLEFSFCPNTEMVHELSPTQEQSARLLVRLSNASRAWPSVLVTGPPGSGKRTVVCSAAKRLGLKFIEIPTNDSSSALSARLFGSREESIAALSGAGPPGDCGRSGLLLLYLSGLETLPPEMMQCLHRLITSRTYVDASGRRWALADDIWIVGSLKCSINSVTVAQNSWLLTGFVHRLVVDPPGSKSELATICRSILRDLHSVKEIQFDSMLETIAVSQVNLNALRRWVEAACYLSGEAMEIETDVFRQAITNDVKSLLLRVPYRGRHLAIEHFSKWATQFPDPLRHLTISLLTHIADHYYIGDGRYYSALEELASLSGIPPGEEVVFCRWQHLGRSAPHIAHDLKNIARWKITAEVDLEQANEWSQVKNAKWFVLVDDFVGSGRTISSFLGIIQEALPTILESSPQGKFRIMVIAGFKPGLQRIKATLARLSVDVKMDTVILFTEEDTCFHENSLILTNPSIRKSFRSFCLDIANDCFTTLRGHFRLGYGELGALIVFSNTVPNNTLPIIWYDQSEWIPLFPASGLLPDR